MRRRSRTFVLALALGATLGTPASAAAYEYYVFRVPNTAFAVNPVGSRRACITCHDNADGGAGCEAGGGMPPCLNPFGEDFRDGGFSWLPSLAALDSDGDGFTNGQELQEPTGAWTVVEVSPGVAAYVTRPGSDTEHPGMADADGDGFCWYGTDTDGDGMCTSAGESASGVDCDDDDAAVNSDATEICTNAIDNDCNGLATRDDPACRSIVDRDGDGFCPMGRDADGDGVCIGLRDMTGDVDCDDDAPTVFPGAGEHCGDGLDNDCDGDIDTADSECTGDADVDGDGYCPIGRDDNGDGDCLDPGEPGGGFDCNDMDAAASPGNTEICNDGIDNDCDGLPDNRDPECIAVYDADGDGFCPMGRDMNGDRYCVEPAEMDGSSDCDDTDASIHPDATEICTNGLDEDCDGLIDLADTPDCDGYIDADGDRYCAVGFDFNGDGVCTAEGEDLGGGDCDETSVDVRPGVLELCLDGLDNDCNGITDAYDPVCAHDYVDFDHDGWCEVGQDLNGDTDCTDAGEQAGGRDEAPNDPTINPSASENCLDGKDNDQDGTVDSDDTDCVWDRDADGDGFCPLGQDLDGDGSCTGAGENRAVTDCDDGDPEVHPDATELCEDWVDNDCDGDVDLIDPDCFWALDRDGDGFCGMGIDDTRDGDCLDEAEDRYGMDCDDLNPRVNPRASEICDDGIDNDCDGDIDVEDAACPCAMDEECDDGDECTTDRCGPGGFGCEHVPNPMCTDAGPSDGGPPPDPPGGCGATGTKPTSGWLLGLGLFAILLWRRRGGRVRWKTRS